MRVTSIFRNLFSFAILLVAVSSAVYAGGAAEEPAGTEATLDAETAVAESSTGSAAALQALSTLGIQVFSDEVQAQDFTLALLGGEEVSLSGYEGRLVFLNFWATWCGPCIEEMPSMQVLYDELSDEGLEVVAVNLQEAPGTVQAFIDEHGYTYPILLDRRGEVGLNYSVRGIPSTFIIAPDGRLLGMKIGFRLWDEPEVLSAFRTVLESL